MIWILGAFLLASNLLRGPAQALAGMNHAMVATYVRSPESQKQHVNQAVDETRLSICKISSPNSLVRQDHPVSAFLEQLDRTLPAWRPSS